LLLLGNLLQIHDADDDKIPSDNRQTPERIHQAKLG
jgi:hypothetical protein